jgi:hypothetical protein
MRSEVITSKKVEMVFCDVISCTLVDKYQYVGGIYHLHLQGIITYFNLNMEATGSLAASVSSCKAVRCHIPEACNLNGNEPPDSIRGRVI